jgi:hypothetical protein
MKAKKEASAKNTQNTTEHSCPTMVTNEHAPLLWPCSSRLAAGGAAIQTHTKHDLHSGNVNLGKTDSRRKNQGAITSASLYRCDKPKRTEHSFLLFAAVGGLRSGSHLLEGFLKPVNIGEEAAAAHQTLEGATIQSDSAAGGMALVHANQPGARRQARSTRKQKLHANAPCLFFVLASSHLRQIPVTETKQWERKRGSVRPKTDNVRASKGANKKADTT